MHVTSKRISIFLTIMGAATLFVAVGLCQGNLNHLAIGRLNGVANRLNCEKRCGGKLMMSIGINLSTPSFYGTEYPFIDRFKTSGNWTARNANNQDVPVALDANGYPTGIPAGATSMFVAVGVDPLSANTDHRYVVTYTGTGNISISQGSIVSSKPGEVIFDYTGNTNSFPLIINSDSASDPISSIHVVREDQVSLFNAGEIFKSFVYKSYYAP